MKKRFPIKLLIILGVCVAAFVASLVYSVLRKTTPEQKLLVLEKEVKPKGGEVFRTVLLGKPVAFLTAGMQPLSA